ncbi:MAG: NADAR family protein [Thiolinea sp.]
MMTSRETLIEHLKQGNSVKYLHFWGHTPKSDGVDKSCLSQWFPASFVVDGDTYLTAEHYMMAQKARLFNDGAMLGAVLACEHPAEAKKFGRQVKNFDADTWNEKCFDYVVAGNVAKFGQNTALKSFLLGTHNRVLVEASPRDRIWGIGMGAANENACNPENWRGRNLLGFALMVARQHLAGV